MSLSMDYTNGFVPYATYKFPVQHALMAIDEAKGTDECLNKPSETSD